ncbi:hypothetical protein, partial [Stenotrophomonas maltophilia]
PVPFLAVAAQGRKERLQVDGQAVPALNFWQLPSEQPLSGAQYRQQQAAACASAIVDLLNGGQQGRSGFVRDQQ